jgi:hypothetical protein
MAKNYKIVHMGVGPWKKGQVVSADHIDGIQGNIADESDGQRTKRVSSEVDRLVANGAIEETDEDASLTTPEGQQPPPELTKGDNVDPGSEDTVHKRAARREDAVGKGNTGMPGKGAGAAGGAGDNLDDMTVAELHQRASDLNIEGRSELKTRDELLKAIRAAERRAAK